MFTTKGTMLGFGSVTVLACITIAAIVGTGCGGDPKPAPPGGNTPAPAPAKPPAPDQSAGLAQFPQDQAPRRDVDWSLMDKDPIATRLGNWKESVDAHKVCLQGTDERCKEMLRTLNAAGSVSGVQAVMDQVNTALPVLMQIWSDEFTRLGKTFAAPTVLYYGVDAGTPGVFAPGEVARRAGDCMKPFDNSLYCDTTNTVYLDAVYLARAAYAVKQTDGTSGKYAAIAVAAHEIGHAVHVQTGDAAGKPYQQELLADCFAGAAVAALRQSETGTGQSQAARIVNTSDALAEGQLGIYLIGGPKMVDNVHESGPVRADFFTGGFNMGVGSCAKRVQGREPGR